MLLSQLIVGIGQFLYSAVTARAFTPSEFGAFVAVLSLQGLLILLTTTGLPSIVLREKSLSSTDVTWIRIYALVGGVVAGIVFVLVSAAWLRALNAPDGTQYVPLLTIALLLGPLTSVEASLLRREGRPVADALTFVLAFTVPASAAVAAALVIGAAWALALVTALGPITLGISSALVRRAHYRDVGPKRHSELLGFAARVSAQNIVFYLIFQTPSWVVGGVLGASSLGQYSRANTLTGIPSTSLSTALNRATQPHWRKLTDANTTASAIRDTALLTSNFAFPIFAILTVTGPDLSVLWLGPGWEQARELVPWLAIAFGLQVPFGILSSSLEMRGFFAPVRTAQFGLAIGLLAGLSAFAITKNLEMAAIASALSQAGGLLALLGAMARTSHVSARTLFGIIGLATLWSIGFGTAGFIGVQVARFLSWHAFGSSELAAVLTGGTVAVIVWVTTFRWQPTSRALAMRGIRLPGFMVRLPLTRDLRGEAS